jgi:peptidylprolyl isomerase
MKQAIFVLLAASVVFGQTQSKPAVPAAKPGASAAKPSATQAKPSAAAANKPASDMPAINGIPKTLFAERYVDTKLGTGAEAEPNKLYHVLYSGYLASTGQKFDSSSDHRAPILKDGKPVMGPDGKPQLGEPQPLVFPQGVGRLIPGFDQGFVGMKVGGKRRIFIPWQLGYGMRDLPARDGHVGIPAKSDLVFDVELVEVTEIPQMPAPQMPPHPTTPPTGSQPGAPPAGSQPSTPPTGNAPGTPPPGNAPETTPQNKQN